MTKRHSKNVQEVELIYNYSPLIVSAVTGILAFLVYLRTLTVGMQLGDGTELAACAHVLGVPHPTGYPLYMVLLKLWLFLTVDGEVILRTTLFNAVAMGAAASLTVRILMDLLKDNVRNLQDKAFYLICGAAGLSSAFMRAPWSAAVVTEVYALQFLLTLLFIRACQKYILTRSNNQLLLATFWVGLGLTHHRMSLFMLPVLTGLWLYNYSSLTGTKRYGRQAATAVGILLLCLSIYGYLPIRAAANPPINWGDADTTEGLLFHLRGGDFVSQRFLRASPAEAFTSRTYREFMELVSRQVTSDLALQAFPFHPRSYVHAKLGRAFYEVHPLMLVAGSGIIVVSLAGAFWMFRRHRAMFLCMVVPVILNLALVYLYNIADIGDYYLLPFWYILMCVFFAICKLADRLASSLRLAMQTAGGYACLAIPACLVMSNWNYCNRSNDLAAEQLSAIVLPGLNQMPADSILITNGDNDIYTSWYRQLVRKERTDVFIFGGNFIHRPWYRAFFTSEQISRYNIQFGNKTPYDPREYATLLTEGIIDANVTRYAVFISTMDQFVLQELAKRYTISPVARQIISPRDLLPSEEVALFRISASGNTK